jgi:tRNA threonylcarbamoyl adenosine modification protein YeaZ
MWLGVDTTTEQLGLALVTADGAAVARVCVPAYKDMAALLHPQVLTLLRQHNLTVRDLTGIGVTCGPGSYTGMRLGLAAARGLALAYGQPVVGLNAHAVMAEPFLRRERPVAVVGRANAGDVYLTVIAADGSLIQPSQVLSPDAARDLLPPEALLIGNAVSVVEVTAVSDVLAPDPTLVADMGRRLALKGVFPAPEPLYLHALAYRTSPGLRS